jgi:hypothetical protein
LLYLHTNGQKSNYIFTNRNDGVGDTLLPSVTSPSEIIVTTTTTNNSNDQSVYRDTTVPMKKSNLTTSREKLTLNLRNVFQPSKNTNTTQKNASQTAAQAAMIPAAAVAAPRQETEQEEQKRLIKKLLEEQRLSELSQYSQFSPATPSISSYDTNISSIAEGGCAPFTNNGGGNYNELGIPSAVSPSRWLPSTQRELLEKQAKLLVNKPVTSPKETSI